MHRDFDLIRTILLDVEALPPGKGLDHPKYSPHSPAYVAEHVLLLIEGGLVEGSVGEYTGGYSVHVRRLTWSGHDFLQSARDDTVWNKAKEVMKSSANLFSFDILSELLKSLVRDQLGI